MDSSIAQSLVSQHQIQLNDLFPDSFMQAHTKFSTIDQFLAGSGFSIQSQTDFEKVTDEQWNQAVKGNTSFATWQEMQEIAYQEWITRGLS